LHIDRDVYAGILFALLGAGGLWVGADYAFGTAARMGAGFTPKLLCWTLLCFGVVIMLVGVLRQGESMEAWSLRPLFFVLASVLIFGILIERVGLVAAAVGLTLFSAAGTSETRWGETVLLAAALAGVAVLIFIKGLGLTMTIFPGL
jgi:putative tricarboxylic transport membrane protein